MGWRWKTIPLKTFTDSRGTLKKVLKQSQLDNASIQEVYLLYSKQGSTRGNHYHKITGEFFYVVSGTGTIVLQEIPGGIRQTIELSSGNDVVLMVPPGVAHALRNESEAPLIILALSTREYNEIERDTFPSELI